MATDAEDRRSELEDRRERLVSFLRFEAFSRIEPHVRLLSSQQARVEALAQGILHESMLDLADLVAGQ
jgi:hypothetical protein